VRVLGHFLDGEGQAEDAGPRTAEGRRDAQPEEAGVAERLEKVGWVLTRLVDLPCARLDLVLGETADALAKLVQFGSELEVHRPHDTFPLFGGRAAPCAQQDLVRTTCGAGARSGGAPVRWCLPRRPRARAKPGHAPSMPGEPGKWRRSPLPRPRRPRRLSPGKRSRHRDPGR